MKTNYKNICAFDIGFSQICEFNRDELGIPKLLEDEHIDEGIDIIRNDDDTYSVKYNQNHNDGVDSSLEHNPTVSTLSIPSEDVGIDSIKVYAIMQRVDAKLSKSAADGNPLLYAMKKENNMYQFATDNDLQCVNHDIAAILDKFVKQYFSKIHDKIATVVIPSGNALNSTFARLFQSAVRRNVYRMKIYDDVLDKLTTDVVRYEVLDNPSSKFNKWLESMPLFRALRYKYLLNKYLKAMDEHHDGTFSYHLVRDPRIRNHMSLSMKLSKTPDTAKEYGDINECHVILLDDSLSRGTSMREACELLVQGYAPKSITGLVMFSSLNPVMSM